MKPSFFTILLIILVLCSTIVADVPQLLNYQGRLTDTNGDPLNGSYSIQFLIYNAASGGSAIWSETQGTVNVAEGIYQVLLGSVTPFPENLFTASTDRYLEIVVAGETLIPRIRFTSVTYAIQTAHSDSADVAASAVTAASAAAAAPVGTAGGDLAGLYPNPTVDGLRGRPVATTTPTTGQALKWNGTAWEPDDDAVGSGSVWQASGADIYFNTGNVAIGKVSPSTALDVVGTITATTFAGSGASLTSLNAGNLSSGTVPSARFSGTYSNALTFSNASNSFTGNGAGLTSLNASNLASGTLPTARLSGTYSSAVTFSNVSNSFTGNGAGLTSLNATNISSGTISSTYLPTTMQPSRIIASDYISADGGMHVGSSTDPGTDNLIVDGSVGFGTTTLTYPFQLVSQNSSRGMYINHDQSLTGTSYGLQVDMTNTNTGNYTTYGTYSICTNDGGNLGTYGVYGGADGTATGDKQGVRGSAASGSGTKYGVYGYAYGTSLSYRKYGVYGYAGGGSTANKYGVYGSAYSTQNDYKWGVYGIVSGGTGSHKGVEGWYGASHYGYLGGNNRGAEAYYDASHWAYLASSTLAGYFRGDVQVVGTLSKSAGSFKIDHPLDPENKYLLHSFVESPDMKNIYDGVVTLNATGEATIQLPEWFGALNIDYRYQLTAIGAPGPNLYIAQEITNNEFRIAGGSPSMKVSWQVTGIRNDVYAQKHRINVEEEKTGDERGRYLNPELYGATEELQTESPIKSEQPQQPQEQIENTEPVLEEE